MGTFKDTTGREWNIVLTVGGLKRIRSVAGIDLMPLFAGGGEAEGLKALLLEPLRMADVVYAAIKPDLDAAAISDEAFGERLAGETLAAAAEAFLDACAVFISATQGHAAAGFLRVATAKRDEARTAAWTEAAKQLAAEDVAGRAAHAMAGRLSIGPPGS